jgi:hypothetical protein
MKRCGGFASGTVVDAATDRLSFSTNGKPSPGSDCKGGNLPEDRGYGLKACLENHYVRACSTEYYVHS